MATPSSDLRLLRPVELTRHGKPVAVLIGRRQFERLTGQYRSFFDAYQEFSERVDLAKLAIDPDELFAGAGSTN